MQNLQLPATWANAIGMAPGSTVSLSLALDVNNPIVHLAIAGPAPGSVALTPLAIAKDVPGGNSLPQSVVNGIQVSTAELLFAPFGGVDASGATVNPGATLVFDAAIGGVWAHIDGNVSLLPYPSLTATASIANFSIGSVAFNQGSTLGLAFSADPSNPKADFLLSGGFTDSSSGVSFSARIDLGASTQLANAGVSLSVTGGLPGYLYGQRALIGQVSASTSGVSFAASGSLRLIVGGYQDLGNVSFSYSSNGGAIWQALQQAPNVIANTFHQIYGWGDATIAQQLRSLKFTGGDVARGIGQGLNETNAQVTSALYRAGYTASQAAQAVKAWSNAGINDIAAGLQSAGAGVDQIVAAAKDAFGNSAATAYNALQAIGQGGQSALAQVANFFKPGSYYVSTQENWWNFPMYLDVAGASQAWNAGVDQWWWNGHTTSSGTCCRPTAAGPKSSTATAASACR